MNNVLEFNNVWKKFKKGEKGGGSLRDAIPNFFSNIVKRKRDDLKKAEFWALKDVSFQVKKGDVLGIIGPNGAGKSTTLKILSKILKPNKGEMKVNGRLSALIEVTAGFHPEFTGRENIYFNGSILGMTKKEIDEKFDAIVDFSGVEEFIDTPVKRYSSGMYARLGFSIAAHVDPDILLVDEVLAVGDMAFQAKCAQKMRDLLSSGTTIVLVSHNLTLVNSLCKRVLLIDRGEVQKEGTTEEIIPYYQNLVYKKREEELKRKDSFKVNVVEEAPLKIKEVFLSTNGTKKSDFKIGEPISIKVDYEAKETIDDPIFCVDIVRSDHVLCCSSNTKDDGVATGLVHGKNSIKIDLNGMKLGPGVYVAHISIWDKEMIRPYDVIRNNIFNIETISTKRESNPVFLAKADWSIK